MEQISVVFGWTLGIMGILLLLKPFIIRHSGRQKEIKEGRDTILQVVGVLSLIWGCNLLAPGIIPAGLTPLVVIIGGAAIVWTYLILLQKIEQYNEEQEQLMAKELSVYAEQLRKKKQAAQDTSRQPKIDGQ